MEKIYKDSFKSNIISIDNDNLPSLKIKFREDVINNYVVIADSSKQITNFCVDNNISSPITFHNLFFYVEIMLKLKILYSSNLSLDELEGKRHYIDKLVIELIQCSSINFDGFYYLLSKIKDKNGKSISYNMYHQFKYNKLLGSDDLIFNLEIDENNKNNVRKVIKWIESNI